MLFKKAPPLVDPRLDVINASQSPPDSSSSSSSSSSRHPKVGDRKNKKGNETKRIERILKERRDNEQAYRERRKTRRFRPGTVAIREIKMYQKSDKLLLAKAPF